VSGRVLVQVLYMLVCLSSLYSWRGRGDWPGFLAASERMVLKPGLLLFTFGCQHQPGLPLPVCARMPVCSYAAAAAAASALAGGFWHNYLVIESSCLAMPT
jgi:hypothetical protein